MTPVTLSLGLTHLFSFELGGEKKTKGAAIQFVSADHAYCPESRLTIHLVSASVILRVSHCFSCANRMLSMQCCLHVLSKNGYDDMPAAGNQATP